MSKNQMEEVYKIHRTECNDLERIPYKQSSCMYLVCRFRRRTEWK